MIRPAITILSYSLSLNKHYISNDSYQEVEQFNTCVNKALTSSLQQHASRIGKQTKAKLQ